MNSKFLQDKVQEIEDEAIEMRLLKRNEKNHECCDDKEKVISTTHSTVSLKHYDQVEIYYVAYCLTFPISFLAHHRLEMSGMHSQPSGSDLSLHERSFPLSIMSDFSEAMPRLRRCHDKHQIVHT